MTISTQVTSQRQVCDNSTLSRLDELIAGLVAFEQHDYGTAVSMLQRVDSSHPAKFAIAQERLGVTHLFRNDPASAIEPLERALQLYERIEIDSLMVAECKMHLGIAYAETGHHEKALSEYRDVLARVPDWSNAYFQVARCHAHRNRVRECVEALLLAARHDASVFDRTKQDVTFARIRESAEFQRRCCA